MRKREKGKGMKLRKRDVLRKITENKGEMRQKVAVITQINEE